MIGGSGVSQKRRLSKAQLSGKSSEQIRKKNLISFIIALVVVVLIAIVVSRGGKHVSSINNSKPAATTSAGNVTSQAAVGGANGVAPAGTGQSRNTSGTSSPQNTAKANNTPAPDSAGSAQNTASRNIQGMTVQDIREGTGTTAANGDQVTVNYVGTLADGTTFDSSIARNQPFTFTLGVGHVIKGWDLGVAGMKVGGERKLVIPPSLGYGSQGTPGGPIPPNATLNFTVDLLGVTQ
jgi:peptidylprolyl isomerase